MITNQYAYNGDGQRVQIIDSQGTKKQIWDGENILLETDGADATQVVYTLEPAEYGNLVSQRRGTTNSYYLFDALGSTRKLTNSAGAVTDSYDFRAYGQIAAISGSTVNVFRWVGELGYYFDDDRDDYYIRARHYSPALARFMSQDPIGFDGSPWNLFEYVKSKPAMDVDPSGLVIRCTQECEQWPNWTVYGCYCGEGARPGRGGRPPLPIDPLDACCQEHDKCYGRNGCPSRSIGRQRSPACVRCDLAFCKCMRPNPLRPGGPCAGYPPGSAERNRCQTYMNAASALSSCGPLRRQR